MKQKLRNYGFWVAITSAVLLFIQATAAALGYALPVDFNTNVTNSVNGLLGVLTLLGIVSNPKEGKWFSDKSE